MQSSISSYKRETESRLKVHRLHQNQEEKIIEYTPAQQNIYLIHSKRFSYECARHSESERFSLSKKHINHLSAIESQLKNNKELAQELHFRHFLPSYPNKLQNDNRNIMNTFH